MKKTSDTLTSGRFHVLIAGVGNIGRFLAELLARHELVRELTLVDRDIYGASNLRSQGIFSNEIGHGKALATAAFARQICARLKVHAVHAAIQDIGYGVFHRADVIFGALDNRSARVELALLCARFGKLYIDCGVNGPNLLARATVFPRNLSGCACYLCGLRNAEPDETRHACNGLQSAPRSLSPAFLGMSAAALAVRQFESAIESPPKQSAEVVLNLESFSAFQTALRGNPNCPNPHHTPRAEKPVPLAAACTLNELAASGFETLRVQEGHRLVSKMLCMECREEAEGLRIERPYSPRKCACGQAMRAVKWIEESETPLAEFSRIELAQPLTEFGFENGDWLELQDRKGRRHIREISAGN